MDESFSENDIKTFRRESFSEKQLQVYLSQHFKRMDLLPYIEGHYNLKLNRYMHSGNWFREIGFPKESIKSCEDFFKYYRTIEDKATESEKKAFLEMITFTHSMLAIGYSKLGMFDLANAEHKKNIEYTKNLDVISYASAINNYGLYFYWFKKELDPALMNFNLAYQITNKHFPTHTLIGSIRDNLADVYVDQGNYNDALPLYQTNFEFYKVALDEELFTIDVPRLINAGSQLVITFIHIGELEKANQAFKELEAVMTNRDYIKRITSDAKLTFLNAKARLFEKQNNYKEAYNTANLIKEYSDSLINISELAGLKWRDELNNITLERISLNFKIDRIEKENKIRSQRSKLLIVSLLSSLVLILLLSLFLRRRQHLINANNKQLLAEQSRDLIALKNEQLESEIDSKKRDLSDFAINLSQNQVWAESLADKLTSIKEANPKEQSLLLDDLEQFIQNKITVDGDTKEFYERLDKLSDSFYSELTSLFPNLSKNEIRLCSLIRLKMDSRNIATLQNITVSSLNTSRYRLRKKLHLSENEDLDDFIQNI
ncbi:transcriptional regulator [Xanthomarina sp. GH4-25]|uniref:transcriptional regulator n=1 Tax=Xanthomarina sp. GH4-25 TaxID=3349335 RepID=UPI0038783D35